MTTVADRMKQLTNAMPDVCDLCDDSGCDWTCNHDLRVERDMVINVHNSNRKEATGLPHYMPCDECKKRAKSVA